jgi:hypothetical protein
MITIIAITTICYLCYSAWVTGGVPESLSATYYGLKEDGWLFQALCIGMAFGLLPMWIEACGGKFEYLPFFACGGLGFVGVAPSFKLKLEGMIHYSAAVVCCVCAILWMMLSGNYPAVLWWSFIGWMLYLKFGQWCWWLEISVICGILTSLI